MKVALINTPFITVRHSSPALSLFKGLLKKIDVDSSVLYLNIDFFNEIRNKSVHEFLVKNVYNGDWIASRLAFGDQQKDDQYFGKCDLKPRARILMLSLRTFYEDFCKRLIANPMWDEYDVFAFSTNIGQNVSAISIAKLLKEKYPNKKIYFGGYGVFGEIGVEVLEKVPWVDAVFWHNSDYTFVEAINRSKHTDDISEIMSGLGSTAYRSEGGQIVSNFQPNVVDHNDIDIPDFHDYLDKYADPCYFTKKFEHKWCNIEFSRGCYYGESVVCTFCSEPGIKMKTKPKSFQNAIKYLTQLEDEYPGQNFTVGDSLLPQGYIENVFEPWSKIKENKSTFFLELKPYVTPKQLKILSESGVKMIQPGIESFHPEILRLTKKGHKVHHGISFLNFCDFFGIENRWNYLVLVPLEKPEWYKEQITIVEKLKHLPPPNTVGRIIITKFTPYSDEPSKYGITELSPDPFYSLIYPEYFDLGKLCWNYDNKYKMSAEVGTLLDSLNEWIKNTQRQLRFINNHSIYDSRSIEKTIEITERQSSIIRFCLYPKSKSTVERNFGNIDDDLKQLVEMDLVYFAENRIVSYVSVPKDYDINEFEEEKNLVQLVSK